MTAQYRAGSPSKAPGAECRVPGAKALKPGSRAEYEAPSTRGSLRGERVCLPKLGARERMGLSTDYLRRDGLTPS